MESKDIVRLGMGLFGTLAALVLGLLIASAKSAYDTQRSEFTQLSANIIILDRIMTNYGLETQEARDLLRRSVVSTLDRIWPEDSSRPTQLEPTAESKGAYDKILALSPQNDAQRSLQAHALRISADLAQTRWLLVEQRDRAIAMPFLVVLVWCWCGAGVVLVHVCA